MNHPQPLRDIKLTPEQIAHAPEAVREWLHGLYGDDDRFERQFIFECHGTATSGDGLAICTSLEIKNLLHLISNELLSCQILFELGCEYRNPATGEHRGHVVRPIDFLHHTDARSLFEVEQCLGTINAALQRLRHDPDATIYRPDGHGGVHVHEMTQHVIYKVWQRILRMTKKRHQIADTARRVAVSEAGRFGNDGNL